MQMNLRRRDPQSRRLSAFNRIVEEQTHSWDVWWAHMLPWSRLSSVELTKGGNGKDHVVSRGCLQGRPVQTDAVSVSFRVTLFEA